MEKIKNLTKQDIEMLRKWGYLDEDLLQISKAITNTDYFYSNNGKEEKITHKQARELLGDEKFLSGISRSAFHYSSSREIDGNGYVFFDSSKMFKKFEKDVAEKNLSNIEEDEEEFDV